MKRCPNCNFPNIDSDCSCFKCGSLLAEELANDPLPAPAPSQTSTAPSTKPSTMATPPEPEPNSSTSQEQVASTKSPSTVQRQKTPSRAIPSVAGDELVVKPNPVFDSNTNIIDFIHTPTHVTSKASQDPVNDSTNDSANDLTSPATGQAPTPEVPTPEATTTDEAAATVVPFPTTPVPCLTTSPPRPGTPARITPKYKSLSCLKVWSRILGILFGLTWIGCGACALLYVQGFLGIGICLGLAGFGILNFFLGFGIAAIFEWMNDVECNQRKEIELMSHVYHKI
ncbi:MAG: hypothetical protein RSE96_03740 [Niameybacter sp.]